jgi:hypothetical protein
MIFELSRDYKKAFELIKKGDRLICLLDYDGCRDVAIARTDRFGELTVGARGIGYSHFFRDQVETDELFLTHCDRLNVEFYLPIQGENP